MSNRSSLISSLILLILAANPGGFFFAQVTDRIAPFYFEANQGQADRDIKFLARSGDYTVLITSTQAVIGAAQTFANPKRPVRMSLLGSHPPNIRGLDALPGRVHYFRGSDPRRWQRNVPIYARVQVDQVYPGIDLVYYGRGDRLEFDFVVAPRANPGMIRMAFEGTDSLTIDSQGDLVLAMGTAEVRVAKPVVYQDVDGARQVIDGSYVLHEARQVGFQLGAYNSNVPLVVDPVLSYSTYLGGSAEDRGVAVAVDGMGNTYLAGITASPDFLDRNGGSSQDAFVVKLNAAGTSLVYAAYLGGSNNELISGVAVDTAGSVYLAGTTSSGNFPVLNAAQPEPAGQSDLFLAKLNAAGSQLIYSTYIGGNDEDGGLDLAVDVQGSAYVIGYTYSTNFRIVNAVQAEFGGNLTDAFVTKLSSSGSLVYSTYLGGNDADQGRSIAVDVLGAAYVTGTTASANCPAAPIGRHVLTGVSDAFVVKLSPLGSPLVYSNLLGGGSGEEGFSVAVDALGSAYVAGVTTSDDFPVLEAFQPTFSGRADIFITKLSASGATTLFSSYLGGSRDESRPCVALDGSGRLHVMGTIGSANFPTINPVQAAIAGGTDMFLTRMQASGTALEYSTYLGGQDIDELRGCSADFNGNAYAIGYTRSTDFRMVNALQPVRKGKGDAVFVKIAP